MSEPTQREELAEIIESHTMSTSDVTCCSCGAWFNEETNGAIDIQHRDHIADALTPFIERSEARTWNEGFSEGYAVGRTRQNPADSDNPYEKGMDR